MEHYPCSTEGTTTEEELQRSQPPADLDLDRAQALLEDFARFWDAEPEPIERRKLILSLFAQVWAKDGQIVAVKPNTAFESYFTAASEAQGKHPKSRATDEATIAGATGLEPAASGVTGRRSNQLSYAPALAGTRSGMSHRGSTREAQYAKRGREHAERRTATRRKPSPTTLATQPVFG
jgi:hypothetical protein